MSQITKTAMRAIKFYKHIVQAVEKFIHKCRPEYKVPGLYVIDSIVRQSRHQYGSDKDVFVPRFIKNFCTTFQQLFKCPDEDKSKIVRVLNLWQKNGVLPIDIIQPLLDLAKDPMNPAVFDNAQRDIETAAAKLGSAKKSSTDVTGDTDGEAPAADPGSKHTDLIESITELLMQQSQQPVSPAAAVAAQQLQQQLHNLQRQLLQETASGGSADAAAAALSNLENLAEQLLQQHQASLSTTASSTKPTSAAGDSLAPPPPPPAVSSTRSLMAENGGFGTKQAPVAAFNSKLLDYDYDDSDEDLDRGSDSHEHHLEDSNDHEPVKAPANSSVITTAASTADSNSFKPQELLMANSLASQHLLLPPLKPPHLYHEHMASSSLPPQPLYGFPDFQHHAALLATTYNGQVISSLLQPASLALAAGTGGMQQHAVAAGTGTADGRLVVGGTMLHSSEMPHQPPMPHAPPPTTHAGPPVPHAAPPLPHAPPPVPHVLPPMPTSQPPLPPSALNDSVATEEDVDYRTDMDYRVLRDRDERDRTRDDRERSGRDGRRRSRSPRRYRSPERDSRHRRSRSRERRNRSRSREREREELERKKREKERERRHQGLPPLRDKCAIVCSTTLWIGRLNKQTTENDIRRELEQHGPVLTINLIPPRGCAYVCMTTRSDATRALDKLLKGVRLHNNTLKAAWAPPKAIGENLELKSFWDVDRGCAYVPFDRLPSDLGALNGEGVFVDEESLPDHLKQPPQSSPPSPVKEEQQLEKAVPDATGTSTTSTAVTDQPRSPARVATPAQHMSQPFMTGGMSLHAPHVMASLSHQMPPSPSFVISGLIGQAHSMVPMMGHPSRGPPLLLAHGVGPAGVPPPPLGLHPPLPGLIPGGIGVPLSAAGGLFSASPLQRHPVGMPLGLMSLPPLPGGVPPPLPPSSIHPHVVPPLPPALHSHVSHIAAGQASTTALPVGSKEAGHHDENPQLAQAIENIVSNAASIQAVVQAAAAVSAISSTATGSTGSISSAPAVLSSQQSAGEGSLQSEVLPTGNQMSVTSQPSARSGTNTSDDTAPWNKKAPESKDSDSGELDDSVMEESVDEEDEDDGGANSMGGPSAVHQHHRQQYQYRGQGHRPYLPRPPAGPPGQPFQPDGRRMPSWGPRNFPPPGFQGPPPPPTHMRPPPQFGFRPLMHEPPFNPRMVPPGMVVPPPLGHHGPPPPLGPPPHGPPLLGILPHGLPPHGLPPHGPPPHFDGPPFDMAVFDSSGPFLGNREDLGVPVGSKPARRSRWQDGMRDDEVTAPPGGALLPLPSHGEDSSAAPLPTVQ